MTSDKKTTPLPRRFRLNTVTLKRRGRVQQFPTFAEALEAFRPWVGFAEAIRIFETTFGI
jgi:hypothetical protein